MLELKSTVLKIQNSLGEQNNRIKIEENICKLEVLAMEVIQSDE